MFWSRKNRNATSTVAGDLTDALGTRFSPFELETLDRLSTPIDLPTGCALTTEGQIGSEALIVVSGTASVRRNDEVVATVQAGDIVGEMALLTGERRNATVVAETPMRAYVLSPREFSSLINQCPRLAQVITTTAVRRLATA